MTWDRDFDALVRRIPEGNRSRFKRLGRITFSCNEVNGRALAEKWIQHVELHYAIAVQGTDVRMMVQIQENGFKVW